MKKVAKIIDNIIDHVESVLPPDNISGARELVNCGEWGEALSIIVTQLYEYDRVITYSTMQLIESAHKLMGIQDQDWKKISVSD
jgi:hypothetical protein